MGIYKSPQLQESPVVLLARVADELGNLITQSEIHSVTVTVIDLMTGTEDATSFAPAQVVFNSLQTDSKWTQDTTGYNLAIPLDGSFFPNGNTTYQVECRVTPFQDEYGTDASFLVVWQQETTATYS